MQAGTWLKLRMKLMRHSQHVMVGATRSQVRSTTRTCMMTHAWLLHAVPEHTCYCYSSVGKRSVVDTHPDPKAKAMACLHGQAPDKLMQRQDGGRVRGEDLREGEGMLAQLQRGIRTTLELLSHAI